MGKPILCLDFDGVLHAYTSGWRGPEVIDDGPVPGAMAFLAAALEHFDVCILSSRSHQQGGRLAMWKALRGWLSQEHGVDEGIRIVDALRFVEEKPPAFLTIDDRAICFDGTFPDAAALLDFKPWNKRDV